MDGFADRYRKLVFALFCAAIVGGAIYLLSPFFPGLIFASVLTVLMYPMHQRLQTKMSGGASAGVVTFAALALVGIPIALVGFLLAMQVNHLAHNFTASNPTPEGGWTLDTILAQIDKSIGPFFSNLGLSNVSATDWYQKNRDQLSSTLAKNSLGFVRSTFDGIITLVVAFLTMFFALKDSHRLLEPTLDLLPLPRERAAELLERLQKTIQAVFFGVILVAGVQGALAGIAYFVVGVPSALVWTIATMVLCAIPLMGAPLIYLPLSVILAIQGKPFHGLGLALWGLIVVSNTDNFLRPFIIGMRVPLHPIAIFFSLLGGILAMGPAGLIAGPLLLTLLLFVQEVVRENLAAKEIDDPTADIIAPGDADLGTR